MGTTTSMLNLQTFLSVQRPSSHWPRFAVFPFRNIPRALSASVSFCRVELSKLASPSDPCNSLGHPKPHHQVVLSWHRPEWQAGWNSMCTRGHLGTPVPSRSFALQWLPHSGPLPDTGMCLRIYLEAFPLLARPWMFLWFEVTGIKPSPQVTHSSLSPSSTQFTWYEICCCKSVLCCFLSLASQWICSARNRSLRSVDISLQPSDSGVWICRIPRGRAFPLKSRSCHCNRASNRNAWGISDELLKAQNSTKNYLGVNKLCSRLLTHLTNIY